ncbi:glucosamine-6-phosphate deaminase [Yoonia sp. SS1-5]|uniref:Glucosamine-6-phosphate deaminase n=1 Tax=Yoonia rhodophyticola TaxID=3137370 RepID=A0AAN0MAE6_9RHOB
MRVVICQSAAEATERTVATITRQVRAKPDSVLGLATGGTMEAVYAGLIAAHQAGLSFAQVRSFNLDEYVGLPADHPHSYAMYMRDRFVDHVDLPVARCHLPAGQGDPAQAAADFEALIAAHGPIDLQLLGLGRNGHIGFNEPASALTSRTREKALSQTTLDANRRFFGPGMPMPQSAITMGIGTILDARKIVMLALGSDKAEAVQAMIEGPLRAYCPASAVQLHRHVTIFIDPAAAAGLTMTAHYRHAEALQQLRDQSAR